MLLRTCFPLDEILPTASLSGAGDGLGLMIQGWVLQGQMLSYPQIHELSPGNGAEKRHSMYTLFQQGRRHCAN